MVRKFLTVDGDSLTIQSDVQAVLDTRIASVAAAQIPPVNPLQGLFVGDGSATVQVRPTTNLPVAFITTTQPPPGGSTAGGTAKMIVGFDVWINPNAMSGTGGGGGGGTTVIQESPLGSGNYPNRDASTSARTWSGVIEPAGGGSTAGGSPQMVNNLDYWQQIVAG